MGILIIVPLCIPIGRIQYNKWTNNKMQHISLFPFPNKLMIEYIAQ